MMSLIKTNWRKLLLIISYYLLPMPAFAACPPACDPTQGICNPIPAICSIPDLIRVILEGLLKVGMPIVALAVIYAGFLFVAARGNPEKLETAKQTLLYTLIGAAILLGSWAIAQLISETVEALQ
jgi:hypothetical protein